MADISTWSTTAASNNSTAPDGFPEGMAANTVNDASREVMAAIRRWYEDAEWIDLGYTPTRTGNTTFTIAADVTTAFHVGRAIKCTDTSTLYGVITASSYSAPDTTVTVALDFGDLSSSLSAVSIGILSASQVSLPSIGTYSDYEAITGTETLVLPDRGKFMDCTSGTFTVTLPAANVVTTAPFYIVTIGNSGAGTITVARAGSDTINGGTSVTVAADEVITLTSDGSSAWLIVGGYA